MVMVLPILPIETIMNVFEFTNDITLIEPFKIYFSNSKKESLLKNANLQDILNMNSIYYIDLLTKYNITFNEDVWKTINYENITLFEIYDQYFHNIVWREVLDVEKTI